MKLRDVVDEEDEEVVSGDFMEDLLDWLRRDLKEVLEPSLSGGEARGVMEPPAVFAGQGFVDKGAPV